jgi:hypothetical protein
LKKFALLALVCGILSTQIASGQTQKDFAPDWIKNDARMLWDSDITDEEFVNAMKWLIENNILHVQHVEFVSNSSPQIPQNVKTIAYFWSQDRVSDREFLNSIQYLVSEGVIPLSTDFVSKKTSDLNTVIESNENQTTVVIIPTFTAIAYSHSSFYAYYFHQCDQSCLITPIEKNISLDFTSSKNGVAILKSMGYDTVTDIDVDKNPRILSKYDRVIVLHNEYVTQNEFNAITSHSHVIFLYPNSLYAKVVVDYTNNTMTLVRGHGYPDKSIINGFDWEFDNSVLEYDTKCSNWNFYQSYDYVMLNCYPENVLSKNIDMLKAIRNL